MGILRKHPLMCSAATLVISQLLLAAGASWISRYDPTAQSIVARLQRPCVAHWLGTDQLGRDTLARLLYGYRASLVSCLGSVGLAMLVGGAVGLLSAYYQGWLDRILMRIMDVLFAFPILLLAIGIVAVLGPKGAGPEIAIAVVYTPICARLLRGPALVIRESTYVYAARAIGASDWRIIVRHLLPNLTSVVLVQGSLLLSGAILAEASLSFLGLGTQPPSPSLGLMLAEGRDFFEWSPWSSIFAGLAILSLSFGFNLLGDCLRDSLDPRLRS